MPKQELLPYYKPPVAYKEEDDPDIFWKPDPGDTVIPKKKGFINDFLYATRGIEAPTLISLWSALFTLSTYIKREAWIKWFPQKMYSNDYIIVIGPAGIVKKSTAANMGKNIIRGAGKYIRDENLQKIKTVTLVTDKNTPESILNEMLPGKKGTDFTLKDFKGNPIMEENGRPKRYKRTSEASIHLSEMGSLFAKNSYMESLTSLLLDIYDTHDQWIWNTLSRGKKTLRNLHTGLFAAVTVEAFRNSIPKQALADGFMSRCALVYVPATSRIYPYPKLPEKAPSEEELARRLAWIACNAMGEYELSEGALTVYDKWYHKWKEDLKRYPEYQGIKSRESVRVLKLSLLLRCQRYENGAKIITEEDVHEAIKIIEYTTGNLPLLLSEIIEENYYYQIMDKVTNYMKRKKKTKRVDMIRGMRFKTAEIDEAVSQLVQEMRIHVFSSNGERIKVPRRKTDEVYHWVEPLTEEEKIMYGDKEEKEGEEA